MRYTATLPGCDIDLSDNTNLWGSPPAVKRVLSDLDGCAFSRYPSAYSDDLKRALARYAGVDPSMIVVGCGSDDVLDSAIRSLAAPGGTLAQLDPSFTMIASFAAVSGLSVIGISPASADMASAFADSNADLIYLCSPNNPTGTVCSRDLIERVIAGGRGYVIIDEAYAEFAGASSIGVLQVRDNVLVTRTMSKAFGLAGFRIGYAVGSPDLIDRVEAARGPYKVTTVSERVALAVLEEDMEWVAGTTRAAVANRRRFAAELSAAGHSPLESEANFVLVPVADAASIARKLRACGIAVRCFARLAGIGDAVRISIGPWPMMERCLNAFSAAQS